MRAFVLGAYIPHGGTYMAYLLGRILHEEFGLEVIVVNVQSETIQNNNMMHTREFATITLGQLKKTITAEDVLIANPSFSTHMLGLQCAGRKLMYVQGVNTFKIIDGFFDKYVSVSGFVAKYLQTVYEIETTVIPACIMQDQMPTPIPWEEKSDSVLVPVFKERAYTKVLIEEFFKLYAERYPDIRQQCLVVDKKIHQEDLWDLINQHRYLLTLPPLEGFGLIPLEAMACGCAVMGFDGMGGAQYMEDGVNCSVAKYSDLKSVVEKTHHLISSDKLAKSIAMSGSRTASSYNYLAFRERWRPVLQDFLS